MSVLKPAVLAILAALSLMSFVATAQASTSLFTDPLTTDSTSTTSFTNDPDMDLVWHGALFTNTFCHQASFAFVAPGAHSATSVTGQLTALTFSSCTQSFGPNYPHCALHYPTFFGHPSVQITGNDTGGTVRLNDVVVRCAIAASSTACYFTMAAPTGTYTDATGALDFTNVPLTSVAATTDSSGSGCTTGTASWSFTHLHQSGTSRTLTIRT
jgi:hypothetical protein